MLRRKDLRNEQVPPKVSLFFHGRQLLRVHGLVFLAKWSNRLKKNCSADLSFNHGGTF